jgi:pyruvate dehydrogenase E2 component (dihydrolipoamide acetyltransferase)
MSTVIERATRRENRVVASPRARRIMRELGVPVSGIKGSGPGGRIVVKDVLAAKRGKASAGTGISMMRRAIAEKTAASFSTTPHFYLRVEADVTALLAFKEQCTPAVVKETGVKPTLSDFLIWAMAQALSEFPYANSVWRQNTIEKLSTVDVGLVVGLPDGLLVPVVKGVDKLTVAGVAKARSALVESAKTGRLSAAETQGGAMSLSNLGNSGVDEFAAVILPGQSSMLAVGRAAPRPFVVNNQLTVRTTMRLCLAVDHRVMDGAPAAEVLGRIVGLLEHPATGK